MAAQTPISRSAARHRPPAAAAVIPAPGAAELSHDQEKTARQMLIDGATFEDVVLTLQARGQDVAQHAVENYFRSDPKLHVLRVAHMLDVARGIRSLTNQGDPEDVELADAVIMTGMQRLHRATSMLDVNDALRRKYERENLRLKQQVLRLKARVNIETEKLTRARTRLLSAEWKKACQSLKEMHEELKNAKQGEIPGPELAARIQEIYGLVQTPPVPPVGAPKDQD
jgi:hypothetical protein